MLHHFVQATPCRQLRADNSLQTTPYKKTDFFFVVIDIEACSVLVDVSDKRVEVRWESSQYYHTVYWCKYDRHMNCVDGVSISMHMLLAILL